MEEAASGPPKCTDLKPPLLPVQMEDMEVEAGLLNKSIQGLMQELRGKGDNVQLLTGEVEAQREMAQRRDEKIANLEVRGGRG